MKIGRIFLVCLFVFVAAGTMFSCDNKQSEQDAAVQQPAQQTSEPSENVMKPEEGQPPIMLEEQDQNEDAEVDDEADEADEADEIDEDDQDDDEGDVNLQDEDEDMDDEDEDMEKPEKVN